MSLLWKRAHNVCTGALTALLLSCSEQLQIKAMVMAIPSTPLKKKCSVLDEQYMEHEKIIVGRVESKDYEASTPVLIGSVTSLRGGEVTRFPATTPSPIAEFEVACGIDQTWQNFWSDEFFYRRFLEKQGDKDILIGKWTGLSTGVNARVVECSHPVKVRFGFTVEQRDHSRKFHARYPFLECRGGRGVFGSKCPRSTPPNVLSSF